MTDYGTIKIPEDEYREHNKRRQNMGLTWAEYIDGQAPDLPELSVDAAQIANLTADEVERRLR